MFYVYELIESEKSNSVDLILHASFRDFEDANNFLVDGKFEAVGTINSFISKKVLENVNIDNI